MESRLFKVALSTVLLFTLVDGGDITCTLDSSNPCLCKAKGTTIDISKKLKFPIEYSDGGQFSYQVDLCNGIQCNDDFTDKGCACQKGGTKGGAPYSFNLGRLSTVNYTVTSLSPLEFSITCSDGEKSEPTDGGGEEEIARKSVFVFKENKSTKKSSITSESDSGETLIYTFNVELSAAGGNGGNGGNKIGVIGLVLIILVLVAIITYLVAGGVYMYKFRGARGAEVIPQWIFWKQVPFLVKDGCLFTFGPCVRKIRGSEYSYEKI